MTSKACPYRRDEQVEFAYGEMDATRADAYRAHLDRCPACREAVAELKSAANLCAKARELSPSEPVWTREFDPGRNPWWRQPVIWGPALAGTLGLLVWLLVRPALESPHPTPRTGSHTSPQGASRTALPVRVSAVTGDVRHRHANLPDASALSVDSRLFTGDILMSSSGSAQLEFDHGSQVLLPSASTLQLVKAGPGRDELRLTSGSLACRVQPRQASRPFEITAGPGVVRVVGTTFALELADGRLVVGVARGAVQVGVVEGDSPAIQVEAGRQVELSGKTQVLRTTRLNRSMQELLKPLIQDIPGQKGARIQPKSTFLPAPERNTRKAEPADAQKTEKTSTSIPSISEPPAAVESFESLVQRLHQDTHWIFDELRTKMSAGQWEQVLRYLTDYLADPESHNRPEATFLKAVCQEKLGKIRQAHQTYRTYLLTWPAGERATEAKHGLIRARSGK